MILRWLMPGGPVTVAESDDVDALKAQVPGVEWFQCSPTYWTSMQRDPSDRMYSISAT